MSAGLILPTHQPLASPSLSTEALTEACRMMALGYRLELYCLTADRLDVCGRVVTTG